MTKRNDLKAIDDRRARLRAIREALDLSARAMGRVVEDKNELAWYTWETRGISDLSNVRPALEKLVDCLDVPDTALELERVLRYMETGREFPWQDKAPPWRAGKNPTVKLGRPFKPDAPTPAILAGGPSSSEDSARLDQLAGLGFKAALEAASSGVKLPASVAEILRQLAEHAVDKAARKGSSALRDVGKVVSVLAVLVGLAWASPVEASSGNLDPVSLSSAGVIVFKSPASAISPLALKRLIRLIFRRLTMTCPYSHEETPAAIIQFCRVS